MSPDQVAGSHEFPTSVDVLAFGDELAASFVHAPTDAGIIDLADALAAARRAFEERGDHDEIDELVDLDELDALDVSREHATVPSPIEIVVGRAADVIVDDRRVSRRHVLVRSAGKLTTASDLGSVNGTWLVRDGARSRLDHETELHVDDVLVTIGDIVLYRHGPPT